MIIIGELINTSRKDVAAAVENNDSAFIQELAKKQVEAGAHYVDINAGTRLKDEEAILPWLVEVVQNAVDAPLCLDSPNSKAICEALKKHKGRALINSITDEKERFHQILPLVVEYNARVVALCMNDEIGMPDTADQRMVIVDSLAEKLTAAGVKEDDIFFDPLIKPIAVNINYGNEVLEAIARIKENYSRVHVTCGLSNISYGLPGRKEVNQAFLVLCMGKGMDSAIIDPLDDRLMSLLVSTKALLGKDRYCRDYLKYRRSKME